jgi:arylsulfatase A-like enzyme
MATCVDLVGASYPETHNGKPIQPMEGVSLKPLFISPSVSPPRSRALYWEHMGHAAVRDGDMKLVRQGRNGPWELYDMSADRTELNNLATEYPDQAQALAEKWEAWAERARVKPYPSGK